MMNQTELRAQLAYVAAEARKLAALLQPGGTIKKSADYSGSAYILRRELGEKGEERARKFSWEATAEGLLRTYERVLSRVDVNI